MHFSLWHAMSPDSVAPTGTLKKHVYLLYFSKTGNFAGWNFVIFEPNWTVVSTVFLCVRITNAIINCFNNLFKVDNIGSGCSSILLSHERLMLQTHDHNLFVLTHPVNFPSERKPECPEKTHVFGRALLYSFHMSVMSEVLSKDRGSHSRGERRLLWRLRHRSPPSYRWDSTKLGPLHIWIETKMFGILANIVLRKAR